MRMVALRLRQEAVTCESGLFFSAFIKFTFLYFKNGMRTAGSNGPQSKTSQPALKNRRHIWQNDHICSVPVFRFLVHGPGMRDPRGMN